VDARNAVIRAVRRGRDGEEIMLSRALVIAGLLWPGLVACSGLALAQDYPNRPVKVVVPYAAGGGTDALTRFIARGMEKRLGQPFIIENRSGSGTTIGGLAVARSAPDGYTVMMGTSSTFAIAPGLYKRLQYDPTKDFSPIMLVATVPFVLVVHPDLGVNSLKELIALAKSKPGDLSYASGGVGAPHHIYAELLKSMTGIDIKHVPYRGGGPALNDVVAGHVRVYFADAGPAAPLIRAGKLKALGVTTAKRVDTLPEVPTLSEAGVTGYEANSWQMMVGPAKIPAPIVARLNGALADFMRSPEAQRHFTSLGKKPSIFWRICTLSSVPASIRNCSGRQACLAS
jgi:tripartite-type tricarboxylate transporter receptor subunit TctC